MADPITFSRLCAVLRAVEDYYDRNRLVLPARRYITAGLPAWDCEQVTVRAVRRFPHEGNALVEQPVRWLVAQEGVPVEVEIIRNAPVQSETGDPPGVSDLAAAANMLYDDGDHVLEAVREACAAGTLPGCDGVVWVGWRNANEQGGLMGGVSEFTLNLSS